MAKLIRKKQRIFAGDVPEGQNIAQFGSYLAGSPNYSSDPDVIQSLAAFGQGWKGAVVTGAPAVQDMNALIYLFSRQLAYVLQAGVPEYESTTTYYIGSLVHDGSGTIYMSLTDNNVGQALSSSTAWFNYKSNKITTVTGLYTVLNADWLVRATGSTSYSIYLPTAAVANTGREVIIKNAMTAGTLTVYASPSLIDGAASVSMSLNDTLSFVSNGTSWDIIDGAKSYFSGNVGIGTTTPVSKLQLYGAGATNVSTSANLGATLAIMDSNGAVGNGGSIIFGASGGFHVGIKSYVTSGSNNSLGDLGFYTRNLSTDTTLTERIRILANGNVGIGTASPSVALDVVGAVNVSDNISAPTMHNFIINGAFDFYQRYGSGAVTTATSGLYGLDRWYVNMSGTLSFAQRSLPSYNPPTGFYNYGEFYAYGGNASFLEICQPIETANTIQLAGKTVTVSFYARAHANTVTSKRITYGFYCSTSADSKSWTSDLGHSSATDLTYGTASTDWKLYTQTITIPSNALTIGFSVTSYTEPWLQITKGQAATGGQNCDPTTSKVAQSFIATQSCIYAADIWIGALQGTAPTGYSAVLVIRTDVSGTPSASAYATSGTRSSLTANAYNTFTFSTLALTVGTKYWINFEYSVIGTVTTSNYYNIGVNNTNIYTLGGLRTMVSGVWQTESTTTDVVINIKSGLFANDGFHIAGVMLNLGSKAAPFRRSENTIGGELALCQRYYEKSYDLGTGVATGGTLAGSFISGIQSTYLLNSASAAFRVVKLKSPTVHCYSTNGGSYDLGAEYNTGSTYVADRALSITANTASFGVMSPAGNFTAGNNLKFHWSAEAEI